MEKNKTYIKIMLFEHDRETTEGLLSLQVKYQSIIDLLAMYIDSHSTPWMFQLTPGGLISTSLKSTALRYSYYFTQRLFWWYTEIYCKLITVDELKPKKI